MTHPPVVDVAQPVAWRVKNDFGHWYVTQDKALADTYRDIEKKDVQPLYRAAQPNRLLKLAEGCKVKADLYAKSEVTIPASFNVIADELERIARCIPGITTPAPKLTQEDLDGMTMDEIADAVEVKSKTNAPAQGAQALDAQPQHPQQGTP